MCGILDNFFFFWQGEEVRGEGASKGFQTETHQLCLWIPTAPAGASEQVHRGIKHGDTGGTGWEVEQGATDSC